MEHPGNFDFFQDYKNAAVIVAHPDDETIWCGGTILLHPEINWTILSLTRKYDPDRAPKFFKALKIFNAKGFIADIDDSPDQKFLQIDEIQSTILANLNSKNFDAVITHNPKGEYQKHLRHQQTAHAVANLVKAKTINCRTLLNFAYKDCVPVKDADLIINLPKNIWKRKKEIITKNYGFSQTSFEYRAASKTETFIICQSNENTNNLRCCFDF